MEALKHRLKIATPPCPEHFEPEERALWDRLHAEYRLGEAPTLAILTQALEAHHRCRVARLQIEREGMTYADRWGQPRAHPLCAVERDARAAF